MKVYLYPDRMEITSYPGPVPGIQKEHFESGRPMPPAAQFDFDEQRTYFRVTLPVHPRYQVLHALREATHLWAIGERASALGHLQRAFDRQPGSGALAAQIIEYMAHEDDVRSGDRMGQILSRFEAQAVPSEVARPYLAMARVLLERGQAGEAGQVLKRIPASITGNDIVEAAILRKRAGDYVGAHRLFANAYSINPDDPKVVHEFAQTKMQLARAANSAHQRESRTRLNHEAVELLRRAIALADHPMREAWCWYDLARNLEWVKAPVSEVGAAYMKAIDLLPGEGRFQEGYKAWKRRYTGGKA